MNIYENIRNKRKMLETLKGCMYNITHMSAANYSKLQKLVPNERGVIFLKHNSLIYTSYLNICEY